MESKIYYRVLLKDVILLNSIPKEFLKIEVLGKLQNLKVLNIGGDRFYLIIIDDFTIILFSNSRDFTNRTFKIYAEAFRITLEMLGKIEGDIREKESIKFRRFKHNIVQHNGHILQSISSICHGINQKESTDFIKDIERKISDTPNLAAENILDINKSANLLKTDLSVFEIINSGDSIIIEKEIHKIHPIVLQILNVFWSELTISKKIKIRLGSCNENVFMDYKSLSVIITHIFDNISKYALEDSDLTITFSKNIHSKKLNLVFEMTSLEITDIDREKIFDEGYSGECSKKVGLNGDGIGMFIIKKLIELNNGEVELERNINKSANLTQNNSIYQRNKITLKLNTESEE